jgi:lipopolysaccharide/colanic/teichoic acid biosynthesis glycosyltransferase
MFYKNYIKRILDFLLSVTGLLMLLPILVVIAVILAIDFKGTPFFTQKRPGKNEKIFSVLKFKTMNDRKDEKGNLLPDTDRLTSLGIFIRKTSIDELPQLINVLTGDMSLIGPRPLLVRYLPFYTKEEQIRFTVRPGITGLAQISGRNFMSWDEKFEKDIIYVNNLSLKQDAYIFYQTILKVFNTEGVEVDQDSNPNMIALDDERRGRFPEVN